MSARLAAVWIDCPTRVACSGIVPSTSLEKFAYTDTFTGWEDDDDCAPKQASVSTDWREWVLAKHMIRLLAPHLFGVQGERRKKGSVGEGGFRTGKSGGR